MVEISNLIYRFFTIAALFLLAVQFSLAQNPTPSLQPEQQISSKIDEFMNSAANANRFSGSILVAHNGKSIISKGYGMANYELSVPNTPQTVFRVGSLTKQFTSMAIMILQERGKLSVADPICKYLTNCPASWQSVTIRHLLTHTSGIPNFTSLPDFEKIQIMRIPPPGVIELFKDKPLDFAPGEQWRYSNSGYYLLGLIIERVSGKSYENFLQENIFTPLNLKNTGYDSQRIIIKNRAAGYALSPSNTLVNAEYNDMSIPFSAGGLYSTTEDLLIWEQALYTNKLVSRKSIDEMFTPVKNNYAYGWENVKKYELQVTQHGGDIDGFSCYLMRFVSDHVTIIVLSNRERSSTKKVASDLANIVYDMPYAIPQETINIDLDTKVLEKYVGQYQIAANSFFVVTLEQGKLMIQPTGQRKLPISAESRDHFLLTVVNASIKFVTDTQGNVTELIFHQGKNDTLAQKVK